MKTPVSDQREALFRLFGAASDGTLTEQEAATLQQILSDSPTARKLWFVHQDLELGLDEWAASRTRQPDSWANPNWSPRPAALTPLPQANRHRRGTITPKHLALAAALAAAFGLALWFTTSHPAAPATLTRSAGTQWESTPLLPGSPIHSLQELNLDSGVVELAMSSGTQVVFEGPGRMAILSDNSVRLDRGRLHAQVPPKAKGFAIKGPGFSLIDHGTRFGCSVGPNADPEIHVFSGLVEVRPRHRNPTMLQHGQAIALHPDSIEEMPARPEWFVSSGEMDDLLHSPAARMTHASRMLKNHPASVIFFNAAGLNGDQLANEAANPPAQRSALATQHCTLTEGRSPGRQAIAFDGASSRIDLGSIYRTHQAITLLAWIRTPTAARRQNLLCGSGDFLPGEPAWYLYYHNALGFGAHTPIPRRPGHGWRSLHSPPPATPLTHWHLVATVVNARTRTITHFLDGKVLNTGHVPLPAAIRLGTLAIGAPRLQAASQTHHFEGAIDEFALIAAPLSADEILRLYEFGRPAIH